MKILTSALLTSLGNTPQTVACAVEAKINRFQEIDYMGLDGEPVIMAKIPEDAVAQTGVNDE